jgi:hypothetical protein
MSALTGEPDEAALHHADGSHRWSDTGTPDRAAHDTAVEAHLADHRTRENECGSSIPHVPGKRDGRCAVCNRPR